MLMHVKEIAHAYPPLVVVVAWGIVIPLDVRWLASGGGGGGMTNENRQLYDLFQMSSTVCQVGRKPFLFGEKHRLTILFLFWSVFNFSTCIFSYGLWLMVFR